MSRTLKIPGLLLILLPSLTFAALSPDETLILNRARAITSAPLDDFTMLGEPGNRNDAGYRYQLAFLSYGLCSLVCGEPSLKDEARNLFARLVEKMEQPATLRYWKADGFGGDGLTRDNIMYRGHLNLMYALAHDRFGETRFDDRFHILSHNLFDELSREHAICCEPDHFFLQCNSVCALSLWLHDRSFGTSYGSAGKHLLDWARKHMPLEGTQLVRNDYRPSTGKSDLRQAGYANAWVIAFLSPVPELQHDVQAMYADWRRTFAEPSQLHFTKQSPGAAPLRLDEWLSSILQPMTFGQFAMVKGAPPGEPLSGFESLSSALIATTFGLIATRTAGDESLHTGLERTVFLADSIIANYERFLPSELRAKTRLYHTLALFNRSFRGWRAVLAAN